MPSSQVEFRGALEEHETASQSVRATSTPVAGGKSLVAYHDGLGPTFPSENNAGETSVSFPDEKTKVQLGSKCYAAKLPLEHN